MNFAKTHSTLVRSLEGQGRAQEAAQTVRAVKGGYLTPLRLKLEQELGGILRQHKRWAEEFKFWRGVCEERETHFGELSEELKDSLGLYEETIERRMKQGLRENQWLREERKRVRRKLEKIEISLAMNRSWKRMREQSNEYSRAETMNRKQTMESIVKWSEQTHGQDSVEALGVQAARLKLLSDSYS